jgi:serine/threonine protein kinase
VAIKAVHPELSHHDAIVRRFLSEARMIAKLRHASIVTVHAAGGADGLLYYVMDQVPASRSGTGCGASRSCRSRMPAASPLSSPRRSTRRRGPAWCTAT